MGSPADEAGRQDHEGPRPEHGVAAEEVTRLLKEL